MQTFQNCGPKDKAAIGAILERWSSAFANRNPIRALALYAEDGILTPLNSARSLNGRPAIRAFYTRELKPGQALALTGITARIDCTSAIVVGNYGIASARLLLAKTPKPMARPVAPKAVPVSKGSPVGDAAGTPVGMDVPAVEDVATERLGGEQATLEAVPAAPPSPVEAEIDPKLTPHRFRMRLVVQNGEWLVAEHVLLRTDQDAEHTVKMQHARAAKAVRPAASAVVRDTRASSEPTFSWGSLVSLQ